MIKRHALAGTALIALLLGCCQQLNLLAEEIDNAPARAFNAAAALQNAGLHSRAEQKWSEFISEFPTDERIGRAHYFLGVCKLHEQKFAEAATTFETVLSRWPDLSDADKVHYNLAMSRYELANEAKQPDRFRAAAEAFVVVASKYSASDLADDALYFQGECLLQAGDVTGAIGAYQKLITEHASSPRAARGYYDLGVAQQTVGETDQAAKTYQTFLEKPEFATHELVPEIRLRLALCLRETEELDQAAEMFNAVSQLSDFEHASYAALQLGQILLEQQKFTDAAVLLQSFPKKYPDSQYRAEALKTAGQSYFFADQPQNAIKHLTPVADSDDPPAAEAAYWLARAQLRLKQPEQALQTLEKAIGRFGDQPFITYLQFARIDALYELPQRRPETPALYEAFLREHRDHALAPQAAYLAALSSFGQQLYPKARSLAEEYLAKPDPDATEIEPKMRYLAAESYVLELPEDAGARKKAETLYRTLIQEHPEHVREPRARLRIGWCLAADGRHPEAIAWLRESLPRFDPKLHAPEAQWLIGSSHQKLDQHREAIAAFQAAIAANRDWPRIDEVLSAAAVSHRSLDELDQAAGLLRRLVDTQAKSPLRSSALYSLGEIARQQEKHDQAIDWFQQLVNQHPETELLGPALHAVAVEYLGQQKYPQARDWASRLADGTFDDELRRRGRYVRGIAYHGEGNWAKAIEDLNAYREKPADDEEAINAAYVVTLCQISQNRFDEAREVLAQLLKAQPDFAQADQAHYELGHALRTVDDRAAEASAAFRWIAENRPDSDLAAESWFRVAQHEAALAKQAEGEPRRTHFEKAEASLMKGLEKAAAGPLRENMQYSLGDVQFQQQRFADAATTLDKYLRELPEGRYAAPATFLAAQSHYELEQLDRALPLFIQVGEIAFSETSDEQVEAYRTQALYRAGDCAAKLKRWRESQTILQRLLQQYPQFPQRADAVYGVGYALQQQNQLDQAIDAYEQVTEITETETAAKARFMVGEIEFERKKYEDAIEQFLTVVAGYPYEPWQALARFEAARCFVELNDPERAAKTLRELIEKHPEHVRIGDAKKMLADLSK